MVSCKKQGLLSFHSFCRAAVLAFLILPVSCALIQNSENDIEGRIEKLFSECYRQYNDVTWITVKKFLAVKGKKDWIILDVRTVIEQAISVIPGALPVEDFEKEMEKYRGKNILTYCTIGCRSGDYAQKLAKKGFNKVFVLRGGVLSWAAEGRDFVTPEGIPTRAVHVLGEKWNVLPPGYEGGW